ncbi:MAG: hypothetical protein M0Q51_01790 [Bacteroidales bacterium]|nr:hypothetical protein [Bacteroidales bacterium]
MNIFFQSKKNSENSDYYVRAEKLVSMAKLFAIGTQIPMLQRFPQLKNAVNIKNWDLMCTTCATFAAITRVGRFVKDRSVVEELDEIVSDKLKEFDLNGPGVFENLENFIIDIVKQKNDEITPDLISGLAGAWIVWNLTDKKPIEDEKMLSYTLGNIFFTEFANYFGLK